MGPLRPGRATRTRSTTLDKAIDMEPNDFLSFSYVNRGWAYYGLGEYDDALDDYEKACEMGNQFGCEAYRDLKAKIDELD